MIRVAQFLAVVLMGAGIASSQVPTIPTSTVNVSGSTIAPATQIVWLTAATAQKISTITPPAGFSPAGCTSNCVGGEVTFLFRDGRVSLQGGGNIFSAYSPSGPGAKLTLTWYPQAGYWF